MLEEKFLEVLTRVQDQAVKVAPQALDLAIQHERWEGIGGVTLGAALLALAIISLVILTKVGKEDRSDPTPFFLLFTGGAFLVPGLICFLNPWNWVAIFDPKIALLHDVIVKLTNR